MDVTTDPTGFAPFTFVASPGAPMGHYIATTATDADGNTSEFSKDVPVDLGITRSGFSYSHATNRYVQSVTVRNVSGQTIAGPLALVLDNLAPNATLFNPSGTYQGSPYVLLNNGQALLPGQSVTVVLQFVNPSNLGITYDTRVVQLQQVIGARDAAGGGGMLSAAQVSATTRPAGVMSSPGRESSALPSVTPKVSVFGLPFAAGTGRGYRGLFVRGGFHR